MIATYVRTHLKGKKRVETSFFPNKTNFNFNQIMVNIKYQQENTACDISKKNILRSESCEIDAASDMGSQHGHLLHEMHHRGSDASDALNNLEGKMDQKFVKRYDKDAILALRNDARSNVKPSCADGRPFWINGRSYGKFVCYFYCRGFLMLIKGKI